MVKTQSDKQAEATYRAFASQSMELAEVDIQRIRLQAEYAHNELLASRNAQLSTLQADNTLRMQQEEGRRPPATIAPGSHRPGRPAEGRAPATARSAAPDRRPAGPAQLGGAGASSKRAGKRSSVRPACDMAGPSGPAFFLPGDPHIDPMALKVFDLQCEHSHIFEGWFGSHEDYDAQQARGLVTCPVCGSASITKRLSAPRLNVAHLHAPEPAPQQRQAEAPAGASDAENSGPAGRRPDPGAGNAAQHRECRRAFRRRGAPHPRGRGRRTPHSRDRVARRARRWPRTASRSWRCLTSWTTTGCNRRGPTRR